MMNCYSQEEPEEPMSKYNVVVNLDGIFIFKDTKDIKEKDIKKKLRKSEHMDFNH